jgi:hypothetical protein
MYKKIVTNLIKNHSNKMTSDNVEQKYNEIIKTLYTAANEYRLKVSNEPDSNTVGKTKSQKVY